MRYLLVVLVLVAGCSNAPEPVEQIEQPNSTPPSETVYLDYVRELDPAFRSVSDSELVGLALDLCEMLEMGGELNDFWTIAVSNGLTSRQAAVLSAAATVTYCPEHS